MHTVLQGIELLKVFLDSMLKTQSKDRSFIADAGLNGTGFSFRFLNRLKMGSLHFLPFRRSRGHVRFLLLLRFPHFSTALPLAQNAFSNSILCFSLLRKLYFFDTIQKRKAGLSDNLDALRIVFVVV